MAVISLARRSTSKLTLFLPSLLFPPHINPPPSPFSPVAFSSHCSSSSAASPSLQQNSSSSHIPNPLLSPFQPSSHNILFDPSDLGLESNQPIVRASVPDLQGFLELLSQAKGQFSLKQEILRFLRTSPITPTEDLVFSAIWELRDDAEAGILALRWGEECVLECPRVWHLIIWVLGKERRFDLSWSLVRRMHRRNILTSQPLLILMERYAAANEASKAIRTFQAMEKFKLHSDSTAFYTLLHTLCKHKNVEEAEELLFSNRKLYPLGTEGFNIILNGWCNIVPDMVEAKRIWREMSNCCINPDGASYAHMICCFSKVGNLFETLRLYDEMKKRGWVPDIVVYNSLIYVLTRENCIKEAHNIFDKMKTLGLKADVNTYHAMIYPLCEAQKFPEAQDSLDDMIKSGLDPTIETYHAFVKAVSMEGTFNLLKRMRDVGCGPNSCTFLLIFDKFFSLDKSENALRMWHEMRNYNIIPNSSHYISVVQGLAACRWIPKAWEFYNEMKAKGFSADPKLEKLFKESLSSNKNRRGRVGKRSVKGSVSPGVKIH